MPQPTTPCVRRAVASTAFALALLALTCGTPVAAAASNRTRTVITAPAEAPHPHWQSPTLTVVEAESSGAPRMPAATGNKRTRTIVAPADSGTAIATNTTAPSTPTNAPNRTRTIAVAPPAARPGRPTPTASLAPEDDPTAAPGTPAATTKHTRTIVAPSSPATPHTRPTKRRTPSVTISRAAVPTPKRQQTRTLEPDTPPSAHGGNKHGGAGAAPAADRADVDGGSDAATALPVAIGAAAVLVGVSVIVAAVVLVKRSRERGGVASKALGDVPTVDTTIPATSSASHKSLDQFLDVGHAGGIAMGTVAVEMQHMTASSPYAMV